jgi:hypothetical protein
MWRAFVQVHSYVEHVADAHTQRNNAYHSWMNALRTYIDNKDMASMSARRKKAEIEAKTMTNQIQDAIGDIKSVSAEVADKVSARAHKHSELCS